MPITSRISVTSRILAAAVFATAIAAVSASAQQQNVRVRGTIEKVDGDIITVKARDGAEMKLKLRSDARVGAVIPAKLADIKAGTMVGITSTPQADGSLKAHEIHLFPAGQNVNQTHSAWDSMPNSMMTNGQVQTSVASVDGQTLTVSYKMGDKVDQKAIAVTPQTIIVATEPATRADLKPGAKIFVANAPKLADGTIDVASISFGKDGMTPPQ